MNNKLNPVKMPELLAPAGNLESAIAAFECGADAVYAGLGKFNAREMGENFTEEDLARLKGYTVNNGKKLYLTFNTLIKENELSEFGEMLNKVSKLEPDAVIVQDTGAVQLIKDSFPAIDIHASTQMAIHNSAGVLEAAEMGIKRVILERQVSIEEIEKIMLKSPIEIEIFVHGALCCSLSGQCLLSSWLGGFSGNRGKCKQPCRRQYTENGKGGFFLSPGDLCAADMVDQFIKAGISSLKIEGRLKRGDYIKNTVSSYRKILDYYKNDEKNRQILNENIKNLSRSYTRELTHGFYIPVEIPGLIKPDKSGLSGKYIGNVCETERGSFKIKLTDRLHIGDKIRIHNKFRDEKNIITVTSLLEKNKKVKSADKGSIVSLSTGKRIPLHGKVYKTGETVSIKVNRNTLPPFHRKFPIDLDISINETGITVKTSSAGKTGIWEFKADFEKAEKNPVTDETIETGFRKSGSEKAEAGNVMVKISSSLFIPASIQKIIKNEFWKWAADYYKDDLLKTEQGDFSDAVLEKYRNGIVKGEHRSLCNTVLISEKTDENQIKSFNREGIQTLFSSSPDYFLNMKNDLPVIEEIILPHFCSENDLEKLEREIEECVNRGINKFRITSLYQLKLLDKFNKLDKAVSYPFPAANSACSYYLESRGVKKAQGWIELDKKSFNTFSQYSRIETEIYSFGLPFLFATRGMLRIEKKITDDRGNSFYSDKSRGITYLYPDSCVKLETAEKLSSFCDLSSNIPEISGKYSDFNFSKNFQ